MKSQEMLRAMTVKISHFIPLITVLILLCLLATSATPHSNITTDQFALLALKTHITSDPYGIMENWTVPSTVCNWIGVICGKRHHRVTALNISSMGLTGSIPPQIGNLSFLASIDISNNNFGGILPQELVRLPRLEFISLRLNRFTGEVPSWFSAFPQLQHLSIRNNSFTSLKPFLLSSSTNESKLAALDVSFNSFQGQIPNSISNLHNLKVLIMQGNSFSGSIPPSIMNMSGLETLSLSTNYIQGLLPNDICLRLPMLKMISFSFNQMSGHIPSNLTSCPQLQRLSLSYNRIHGTIPQEIGRVKTLRTLFLGGNNLSGPIPAEIGKLGNLEELGVENNLLLTGSIPLTIFNLSNLRTLSVHHNKLTGFFPDSLGNLTKLEWLEVDDNSFTGVIPQVFDKLTNLQTIEMSENRLTGPIPSSMFNISTLIGMSLAGNSLSGNLPINVGANFLPNLEKLILRNNYLDGVLPNSISNSSQLQYIDLGVNKLTGPIPNSLGDLKFLVWLNLKHNYFSSASSGWSFIASLTSCRFLKALDISLNSLNGMLPLSVGNLSSSLIMFSAASSHIEGFIPNEIGNLSGVARFSLYENDLTGVIPSSIGKLSNLQMVDLANNQLVGSIPDDLCKFKKMGSIQLSENRLTASIPECLGNVSSLRYIYLNSNNLTSGIPTSMWNLQDLLELDISSNSITGSLSPQIGNLKVATFINLSKNLFSNDIPNTFNLESVVLLSLAHNRFQGQIPESMGSMLSLNALDLSYNMLSGTIPKSLESLAELKYFNVSFNKLYGEIPTNGPFRNFTSLSFLSNTALCGPTRFQVSPCKEARHGSKKKHLLRAVFIVLGVATLMFISTMAFLMIQYLRKKKSPTAADTSESDRAKLRRMSYYELLKATNEYSESNLLGKGSFGSVYKGVLRDGTILAIKVFNALPEVALKTFTAECDALRNLRHRNLIKVVGSCSNQDFKAILLEYMPNGSLEKWLYSDNHFLDIKQRLNTMIDVASALEYLHHGYSVPVVHCDLKPSNVLLDENLVAHVSDFGITKFLGEEESKTHTATLATLGYMAPEYGLEGRVSTRCDVYSYGVMLLETFTRRRPSDKMFSENLNLKNWVKDSLPNAVSQVIDIGLIRSEERNFNEKLSCVSSVMELGLRCCADYPGERMNMKDVLGELKKIQAKLMLHHPGTSNMLAMTMN